MQDFAAVSLAPFPHAFDEFLAAEVVASLALFGDFTFNDILSGDSGMIGARYPQRVVALHSAGSYDHVLQRVIKCMTEMERTSNVRRRDYD